MVKKILSFLFLAFCVPVVASAFQLPMDRDGAFADNVQNVGVSVYYSTGTSSPYLITGGTGNLSGYSGVRGSSIVIYGILTSTPAGNYIVDASSFPGFVELRATDTANTTSELLVPPIPIGTFITTQPVWGTVGAVDLTLFPQNNFVIFDPPIVVQDNLSVNASSNPRIQSGVTFSFSIFYRYLDTGTPEGVWFPTDDYQGTKTRDHSFYGVKPSSVSTAGGAAGNNAGTESWDFTTQRMAITASSPTALTPPNAQLFFYGYSASTGSYDSYFTCVDSNSALGTPVQNFLPPIYPRTFGKTEIVRPFGGFEQYSFPWPLKLERGLNCKVSTVNDRFRFYTRPRNALR